MIKKRQTKKPYQDGLIGKKAEVKTKNMLFSGKIILETKNTITIITEKGEKTILKRDCEILVDNRKIEGKRITKRTEDRIKTR